MLITWPNVPRPSGGLYDNQIAGKLPGRQLITLAKDAESDRSGDTDKMDLLSSASITGENVSGKIKSEPGGSAPEQIKNA